MVIRSSRRAWLTALAGGVLSSSPAWGRITAVAAERAQEDVAPDDVALLEGESASVGAEVPSYGAARLGPVRPSPRRNAEGGEFVADEPPTGVAPAAMQIDKIAVDAYVEALDIAEDGTMPDPSGPWVVSWYKDLAAPGEGSNVVMAGHVDYWTTGPAVFYDLNTLTNGDTIRVFGEDDSVHEYAFDWMRNYVVADLDQKDIREIVGPTDEESLTIITCAIGTWDEIAREYRERAVLRATRLA